jgi:hypothetical protein
MDDVDRRPGSGPEHWRVRPNPFGVAWSHAPRGPDVLTGATALAAGRLTACESPEEPCWYSDLPAPQARMETRLRSGLTCGHPAVQWPGAFPGTTEGY